MLNRVAAILACARLTGSRLVTLEVVGGRTGRLLSFPAVVADYHGDGISLRCLTQTRTGFTTSVPPTDG